MEICAKFQSLAQILSPKSKKRKLTGKSKLYFKQSRREGIRTPDVQLSVIIPTRYATAGLKNSIIKNHHKRMFKFITTKFEQNVIHC